MSSIHLDMIERKPSNHESKHWVLSEIDKVSQPSNQECSIAIFATEVRHCRSSQFGSKDESRFLLQSILNTPSKLLYTFQSTIQDN